MISTAREASLPPDRTETIAAAYIAEAGGDVAIALHRAIADALADLIEAERRTLALNRLISRGYVRSRL